MIRTLIYARVSTEDQLEKFGLPSQLRACRELAGKSGWTVIEEITDEGVSGAVLDRPGLSRLRQRVQAGDADLVLMLDVDRLSRELAHLLILKPEIERKARLEFVTARFEDSPSGRLFFGIRGVIGQYERELTRERTMRGKRERALEGRLLGGRVAYGYRYEAGALSPDEAQAPVVRQIFDWYAKGLSMRAITQQLRTCGAPTWAGRQWGHSSVRRILGNETYVGVAYYGTHRREGKLLKRRSDLSARIALRVPSLIAREQWERVQLRKRDNVQVGRPTVAYLLRGLLHCSCGRRMSGERRRNYLCYRCNGRDSLRVQGPACRTMVNARLIDAVVWNALVDAFSDQESLRQLLLAYEDELSVGAAPERLEALVRQAAKLRAREERCLAMLIDPDLAPSYPSIKREYQAASREREWAEGQITAANRARADIAAPWLDQKVKALSEYLPTLITPEARQEFAQAVVTRAEWVAGAVKLYCFLGAELGIASGRCANQPRPLPERAWPWFARGHRGNRATPLPLRPPAALCRWA